MLNVLPSAAQLVGVALIVVGLVLWLGAAAGCIAAGGAVFAAGYVHGAGKS